MANKFLHVYLLPLLAGRGAAQGDLMPFPLPTLSEEELKFAEKMGVPPQYAKKEEQWDLRLWRALVLHSLNVLYVGRTKSLSEELAKYMRYGQCNAAQRKALEMIDGYLVFFLQRPGQVPQVDWGTELHKVRVNYSGEEVKTAVDLTHKQVREALPPRGAAARVRALDLAEGQMKRLLGEPELLLRPESVWPEELTSGKVFVESDAEWIKIVRECVELGIFGMLKKEEIFHHRGKPLLNGAFGVGKKKATRDGSAEVLRLIINLIPMNELFEIMAGDIRTLPYGGQWSGVNVLSEDMVAVFSDEDLTCAFYLFELPAAWQKYQALNKPVRARDLRGLEHRGVSAQGDEWLYPAVRVIAMGWSSACGLLQYLHRRLVATRGPQSADLPADREVRKDRPVPVRPQQGRRQGSTWSIYIDNFMQDEFVHIDRLAAYQEPSDWQRAVRQAYECHAVLRAKEKAATRQVQIERLGYHLDGAFGAATTPASFDLRLVSLTCDVLSRSRVSQKDLQILGGRWVRKFQMRRELMMVFHEFWQAVARGGRDPLGSAAAEELILALCLMPLMITDFRLVVSPLVTASDASNTGGGVCRTTGLSKRGLVALGEFQSQQVDGNKFAVGLVELFGGIGGGRRALELLGVTPCFHAYAEKDEDAAKVVLTEWPDARRYHFVEDITPEVIHEWRAQSNVDCLIVVGGFPCQGLTGLNAKRLNLEDPRSQLYKEIERIREELLQVFPRVYALRENVASMESVNVEYFNQAFGVKALRACPSGRTHVRRPRLFWADWSVPNQDDAEIEVCALYDHIRFKGDKAPSSLWAEPGWALYAGEENVLPTFVAPKVRAEPPFRPAGLEGCDAGARERWQQDCYRFPPYQYKTSGGLVKKDMWRYAQATERELLLNFRLDHTFGCRTGAESKRDPRGHEDTRLRLLGESFHCGVVAYLLGHLLFQQGFLEKAPSSDVVKARSVAQRDLAIPGHHRGKTHGCRGSSGDVRWRAASVEEELVCELLRRQTHRGGDVRSTAITGAPTKWPRNHIPIDWWTWKTVTTVKWKQEEHINALELHSDLLTLRWRLRVAGNVGTRCLHLLDSQVGLGALAHGRSPSGRLRPIIEQIGALSVGGSLAQLVGYTSTVQNPADAGSREGDAEHRDAHA